MTQWIYHHKESNQSYAIIVDIEKFMGRFRGTVNIHQDGLPYFQQGWFDIDDLARQQDVTVNFVVYEGATARLLSDGEVDELFPQGYQHKVTFLIEFAPEALKASGTLPDGSSASVSIPTSDPDGPSNIPLIPDVHSWSDFTAFCSALEERSLVFRGQSTGAKLRTAFHRRGRSNMYRFMADDMKGAYRALSGKTRHRFDGADPDQNAAFMNLLQHHGFPTPMLDWTESPFIAAYFAFHHKRHTGDDHTKKIRILLFDHHAWQRDFRPFPHLIGVGPHVTMLYPHAIENPRASPQQALSMITNVDDMENYIGQCEASLGRVYLRAIDLPYSERLEALKDLAMMGITQGTLFPGLDGICEDLRDRFFGRS